MKKLGFGCMRLPMKGGQVDLPQFRQMVDRFIEEGFNYFDTAHGYLKGKSEPALREALTSRYPRDAYLLTDKLTQNFFQKEEDIRPLFESQLAACGVDYFDYYLLHAMTAEFYPKFVRCNAFQTAARLKAEGKIRHVGMSFHDKAEVLDRILSEQPAIEVVQLQFNYVDYEDPGVESRKCYEVCQKHHKPVIVMEPIRGGGLVRLPEAAKAVFDGLNGGSYASYAVRFCASFDGIFMVLSGMSTIEQLEDNVRYMKDFRPFTPEEFQAVEQVRAILKQQNTIPCTTCRYCTDGCPKHIAIPDLFACYNTKKQFNDWNADFYYNVHTQANGRASDCIQCGKCEHVCPQHLPIRDYLKDVAKVFDRKK